MASRYDDLDASTELEQQLAVDLRAALEPRGCIVVHHGTNAGGRHSPGGKPDVEVRDPINRRLILLEVTKRRGSAADGEFAAVTDHLDRAVAHGGYDDYGMLYVSPNTSARMSMNFRDLYNRTRERDGQPGRIVGLDFEAAQLLLDRLISSDPALYPASRFGDLLSRWPEAIDDARARQLVQRTIFPEDLALSLELSQESREFDADRERELKRGLTKVENDFRNYGITGNNANITLVYLAFIRLFEERRQRRFGQASRFTLDGFRDWAASMPATMHQNYPGRMVEALLRELSYDQELKDAGLLQPVSGAMPTLHSRLSDALVEKLILPLFDEYDFHAGRVDVLGAVFETLARRSEKDTRVGQFFTPAQVVDFCADLVELDPTDVVLDPAVGTGRFLIAAMERMLDHADDTNREQSVVEANIRQQQLIGSDIDDWVATIAKMNMFIHGDGKSGIATVNGLVLGDRSVFRQFPDGIQGRTSVVLTNPPLGDTDFTVAERAWEDLGGDPENAASYYDSLGVVPMEIVEESQLASLEKKRREATEKVVALEAMEPHERPRGGLSRALRARDRVTERVLQLRTDVAAGQISRRPRGQHLKGGALFLGAIARYLVSDRLPSMPIEWQGGRSAVVVDEAVLNTPEYAPTREFIRRNFFVKAVVSLSRDAFKYLAHTDAKTSVLYLIKKPSPSLVQREPIFFSHAERVGYSATGSWVGDDLPQVLLHYQVYKDALLSLYQGRHLDAVQALDKCQSLAGHALAFYSRQDPGRGGGRLDFYDARFQQRREELEARYGKLVRLGEILDVAPVESPRASRTGEYDFAVATRTGTITYKGRSAVDYSPKDLWLVAEGDIVLSSIDLVKGAVAVAGADVEGLTMSKEMYAYRLKEGASAVPEYLQILLRTSAAQEMLLGFTTGTSNRTRLESPAQLLDFPVPPLPPLAEQERRAAELRASYELHREAERRLGSLRDEAQERWGPPLPQVQPMSPLNLPVSTAEVLA